MERRLKAERREASGKGGARKVRAKGLVPAVIYGHGTDPMPVSVDGRELYHILRTEAGLNVMIDLRVDGDRFLAMAREVQRDHLRGRLLHVDFLRVAKDEKITVDVPVQLAGESPGVKEGGVLEHHLWTVRVECFPQDVPEAIEANIATVALGESLKASDLKLPPKVTMLTPVEETIVSVVPPQVLQVEEVLPEEVPTEGVEQPAPGESEADQAAASEAP